MKKLILSAAVLFALSLSTGAVAQDKKQDKEKAKTECCSKKKGECTKKKDDKKGECTDKKDGKACCSSKKACDKTKKAGEKK